MESSTVSCRPSFDGKRCMALASMIFPFMDTHFIINVLSWMMKNGVGDVEKVLRRALESQPLSYTYEGLSWRTPESVEEKISKKQENSELLEEQVSDLAECLLHVKRVSEKNERLSISQWNSLWQDELKQSSSLQDRSVRALIEHALCLYSLGDYTQSLFRSRFYLDCVCDMVSEAYIDDSSRKKCLWGSIMASAMLLASSSANGKELATFDWSLPPQYITQLVDALEGGSSSDGYAFQTKSEKEEKSKSRNSLTARKEWAALLHWSIFLLSKVYFKQLSSSSAWTDLLEFIVSEKTVLIINQLAPHLTRYVAAFAILSKDRKDFSKACVEALKISKNKYADPITQFLISRHLTYDFEDAEDELLLLEMECRSDFFLFDLAGQLLENAKLSVIQGYCLFHNAIDVHKVSERLNIDRTKAETWIVQLIRENRLDGQIDSERQIVRIVPKNSSENYQTLLDQAKGLLQRSEAMAQVIEKLNA